MSGILSNSSEMQNARKSPFRSTNNPITSISVNKEEVDKFNGVQWWDEDQGAMKPLISFNKLRVPFVKRGLLNGAHKLPNDSDVSLDGFRILDIGCGGGIFSEGLARVGATVVGIDPGKKNVSIAKSHLPIELKDKVTYHCATIEEYAQQHPESNFDAVVMSEVIEHVENQKEFISTAIKLLKTGGSLFITIPNRTVASWFGAILMAEYVLRILPVGTHEWKKFMTPKEIQDVLKQNGLKTEKMKGITYNPITDVWSWTPITKIHFAIHAIKE